MNIPEFINKVEYDSFGKKIFRLDDKGNISSQLIDLRGWASIRNSFETEEEAQSFQDNVGKWITEAINEKLQRENKKSNKWTFQLEDGQFSDCWESESMAYKEGEIIYEEDEDLGKTELGYILCIDNENKRVFLIGNTDGDFPFPTNGTRHEELKKHYIEMGIL